MSKKVRKSYAAKRIEEANKQLGLLQNMLTTLGATADDYIEQRTIINMELIQATCGCEVGTDKSTDNVNVKYNHKPASFNEMVKVKDIIKQLNIIDERFINKAQNFAVDDDEMGIPVVQAVANIPADVFDMKVKEFSEMIFCKATTFTTVDDFINLAAATQTIRKKINRKRALIIGGIVLTVAVGSGVAIYVHNKNKDKYDTDNILDEIDIPEDTDVPLLEDTSEEDIPHIELE